MIEKILKELTEEKIKEEISLVKQVELPRQAQDWVKEYTKIGDRDEFIWKWLFVTFDNFYLPIFQKEDKDSLLMIKFLWTMFVVMLDDVADKTQDKELLDCLNKIPFDYKNVDLGKLSQEKVDYFNFTVNIWQEILGKISTYPNYKDFQHILFYDIRQVVNVMEYSFLVNNNPFLLNKVEANLFFPYNMSVFVYSDFDILCSGKKILKSIGELREIIYRMQRLARIGNWVSTWEREIKENDFTSGVFVYALDKNIIKKRDLKNMDSEKVIKRIKEANIDWELFQEWENDYNEVARLSEKIKFLNKEDILSSCRRLIKLHLSSKKFK